MTDFVLSTDRDRLDREWVHATLSKHAYWAQGRSRETMDTAIDAAESHGIYDTHSGAQVGYARVVTDGVLFAWLCDVIVDPDRRGEGIGKMLVDAVTADLDARGVRRTLLMTADAHGLYAQYGFAVPDQPENTMVRWNIPGT